MNVDSPAPRLDVACHLNVLLADALPKDLAPALDALVDLGYSGVVLPPLDPASTDAPALRRLFAERNLRPITIAGGQGGSADVSSPDPDERAAGAALLRSTVELTEALGGDQMNGVPYGPFGPSSTAAAPDALARAAREVGSIADLAHDRGITMTFEVLNRYETSLINTAAQAMHFVTLSESDHLRIHLDTFHMAVEEANLYDAIRLALPKLAYLELGQSGRGMLSDGVVDVPEVVRSARSDGYTGRWGIEAFSRSVLSPAAADMLAIWRPTYDDGIALATDAMHVIRSGASALSATRENAL